MFEYIPLDQDKIKNRTIDSLDDAYYMKYDTVVLTCYMTSKKDPQRSIYQPNDNYDYIKPWYETMIKQDLHGIIFYDKLSDEFVNEHQTHKIIFKKCTIGKYSINDERFIIYYQYLLKNPYKYILMTDVSDVFINRNPFDLIRNSINNDKIFVGTNVIGIGATKRTPQWFQRRNWKIEPFNNKLKDAKYDDVGFQPSEIQIYSAGLLGGSYDKIIWFLIKMTEITLIVDSTKNNNMIIFNYIINRYLLEEYDIKSFCSKYIFTGSPFNSSFGKYEKMEESECCLFHK